MNSIGFCFPTPTIEVAVKSSPPWFVGNDPNLRVLDEIGVCEPQLGVIMTMNKIIWFYIVVIVFIIPIHRCCECSPDGVN